MTVSISNMTQLPVWIFPNMAQETNKFGEWLKTERERRAINQDVLAERADTTAATISRYETGKRDAPRSTIIKLAQAMNADVDTALMFGGFAPIAKSIPPQHLAENLRELADHIDRGVSEPASSVPVLVAGMEILVDLREGSRRGTISESTLRAIAELLQPVDAGVEAANK